MASAIAVCNQKGGVGKTTTAVNLGACLAISGKRTLLVDLDPQGSATVSSCAERIRLTKTIYDVLVDGMPAEEAILATQIDRLSLLPSTLDLAKAELRLAQSTEPEAQLRKLRETLGVRYDTMIFDCPPSLGVLTSNALVAADDVLIPVQCEYLALEGLHALVKAIDLVRSRLNPAIQIGGIILTMTDFRSNLAREVAEEVKRFFPGRVFETTIPRNVRLAESPSFGKPVCLYDPHSTGSVAYQLLAKEVTKKVLDKYSPVHADIPTETSEQTAAQSNAVERISGG